jgi:hypothetical protein
MRVRVSTRQGGSSFLDPLGRAEPPLSHACEREVSLCGFQITTLICRGAGIDELANSNSIK